MKKLIVPLSLLPLFLLAACAPAAAPPSPESSAPSSVESAFPRAVSPAVVDYGALEKNLRGGHPLLSQAAVCRGQIL